MRLRRPLPAVQGDTLHIVGVGDNRIGKGYSSSDNSLRMGGAGGAGTRDRGELGRDGPVGAGGGCAVAVSLPAWLLFVCLRLFRRAPRRDQRRRGA